MIGIGLNEHSHYLRHKTFGSTEEKISKFLKEEGFTNESYQLAIKNESKGEKPNMGNYLEWYLVQKKRYIEKPHGLYRGRHLKAVVGDDKIYLSKELKDFDDNYYYFGISKTPKKDEKGHRINRKNLEISYYLLGISSTAQCNEISESEFYRNVEREIKIKKDSVKF